MFDLHSSFNKRIQKTETCWLWVGSIQLVGYGTFTQRLKGNKKKMWLAHRLSYYLATGEDITGKTIMHTCDVRNCVNPAHLKLGTQLENVRDCINKGRFNAGAHNRFKGKVGK